ncbi:integral membrane family protein [Diplodia corticola]|uniref:Integral membrane family protein n=1 Tax=Diplodia corticola TaxID=236234 RepID=A0A1J9QMM5_9PEZI|nr:integral membrane family protein [Diplodia corticola]OJD30126.1 integral membrane family protein [Diplodia corticola]
MSSLLPVNDYQINDSQKHLRASLVICLAVSAVFVLLRVLARLHIQRQFAVDDYLLVLALCLMSVITGFMVHGIETGGFGRPTDELPTEVVLRGIKFLILSQTCYILTLLTTGLSIALLQLRITGRAHTIFNRLHYVSIGANVIMATYEFFTLLFQCYPVYKAWTPTMAEGTCADRRGITTSIYVYSAVNILLFWYYAFAPAPLIWKLQIKPAVKLSSIFVLGVGVLASIATIIRMRYLVGFSKSTNTLQVFAPIALLCWIELCLAICAASISSFRPLLRLIPWCGTHVEDSAPHRVDPAANGKKKLRRGYTFQLSEIDSMSIKEQGLPITKPCDACTISTSAVATPATLDDSGRLSYFASMSEPVADREHEWRLPDLERGS